MILVELINGGKRPQLSQSHRVRRNEKCYLRGWNAIKPLSGVSDSRLSEVLNKLILQSGNPELELHLLLEVAESLERAFWKTF